MGLDKIGFSEYISARKELTLDAFPHPSQVEPCLGEPDFPALLSVGVRYYLAFCCAVENQRPGASEWHRAVPPK
jgi:hypothetical protein